MRHNGNDGLCHGLCIRALECVVCQGSHPAEADGRVPRPRFAIALFPTNVTAGHWPMYLPAPSGVNDGAGYNIP